MDEILKQLLGADVLSEEVRSELSEAFKKKLEEATHAVRQQIEEQVRGEFSQKYTQDKAALVEAADRMITESITAEMSELRDDMKTVKEERKKLSMATKEAKKKAMDEKKKHTDMMENFIMSQLKKEIVEFSEDKRIVERQRLKLSKQIVENKTQHDEVMKSNLTALQKFIFEQLKKELVEFRVERKDLTEQKKIAQQSIAEHKNQLNEQYSNRLKKIEGFLVNQLTKEMKEFHEDKKQLVETRVKLINEGKARLDETRKQFVKRAAQVVENTLETTLKKEMSQFREDIKASRQNHFGRRVFEAFATEYMTSYLAEGTQTKKLMAEIAQMNQKLEEATGLNNKAKELLEAQNKKIAIAEDRAKRVEILQKLLSPLGRDKKALMEQILEDVRTDKLEITFNRNLPAVLNEVAGQNNRARLVETQDKPKTRVAVTGDRNNKLAESHRVEQSEQISEVSEIRRLAGLN